MNLQKDLFRVLGIIVAVAFLVGGAYLITRQNQHTIDTANVINSRSIPVSPIVQSGYFVDNNGNIYDGSSRSCVAGWYYWAVGGWIVEGGACHQRDSNCNEIPGTSGSSSCTVNSLGNQVCSCKQIASPRDPDDNDNDSTPADLN